MLGGKNLFENGTLPHLDGFLLQVSKLCALCQYDAAIIGILFAGNDIEHSGFASTIRPNKGKAIILFQTEGDV